MAGIVLLVMHLLLVAWLTLRPLDVLWVTAANLRPLAGIRADLALGAVGAVRRIGEGLLLLAPLGVLLPMAGGRLAVSPWLSLARTVAAGGLISLGIELLQTGVPGQVVDVDSLLLNTGGVALAHLVVVPAGRARMRRRRASHAPRRAPHPDKGRAHADTGRSHGDTSHGHTGRLHPDRGRPHADRARETCPWDEPCPWEGVPQGATPTIPRVGIAP